MEPEIATQEQIERRPGYQATMRSRRPAWAGVDQDWSRRPGRLLSQTPKPFAHARMPVERQAGKPASPVHGRPNKTPPPVFGTATPLRGLSGLVRRLAYSYADHYPSHWLLMMLGDRVDSWTYRARKAAPLILPVVAFAALRRAH